MGVTELKLNKIYLLKYGNLICLKKSYMEIATDHNLYISILLPMFFSFLQHHTS